MAFMTAAPDICLTGSGFVRYLIIRCLGNGCLMSKWLSTHHRLLSQRCLGSTFLWTVVVMLRWGVSERDPQWPACHSLLHQLSQPGKYSTLDSPGDSPKDSEF